MNETCRLRRILARLVHGNDPAVVELSDDLFLLIKGFFDLERIRVHELSNLSVCLLRVSIFVLQSIQDLVQKADVGRIDIIDSQVQCLDETSFIKALGRIFVGLLAEQSLHLVDRCHAWNLFSGWLHV